MAMPSPCRSKIRRQLSFYANSHQNRGDFKVPAEGLHMAEIVNLRQARKRKARAGQQREAEANRLKFGRPKSEKEHARREEARAQRVHEAHRREDDIPE
jgi:hypothetical protein